jgi:hypothetical protein
MADAGAIGSNVMVLPPATIAATVGVAPDAVAKKAIMLASTFSYHPYTPPPAVPTGQRISGTVKENGALVARTVRVYSRATGEMLQQGVSSAVDGTFSLECAGATEVYAVALDDESTTPNFNAIIYDQIIPA